MSKHYKTTCVWNYKTYSSRTFQQYQELGGGGNLHMRNKKNNQTTFLNRQICMQFDGRMCKSTKNNNIITL
jgi:hypothetical protein